MARNSLLAGIESAPINVIVDKLDAAHAVLDLIYSVAANREAGSAILEGLSLDTLACALNTAMFHIEEARDLARETLQVAREQA